MGFNPIIQECQDKKDLHLHSFNLYNAYMSDIAANGITLESDEIVLLRHNKQDAYNYRFRRYQDWTETYELYRDKVMTNRLTQRQSVNMPLMKQTVNVILKDVDDLPMLHFEELGNDKEAEVFLNEYWKYTSEQNSMELQDIVDKKQVLLFGRSFDQWQIKDGKIKMTVQDTMDILVSRYTDPYNIHSSRYLIHPHNFLPLSSLVGNPTYDQDAVKRLQKYYASKQGLIRSSENQKFYVERQRRMSDLGVLDAYGPILGETYIEVTPHFVYRKEEGDDEEQLYLYIEADNLEILRKGRLEDVIGKTTDNFWRNHFPYSSWASDLERQDFYSDGAGDVVRTPNKVLNSWFSQMVENRTLQNYSMHYYNSSLEGFNPATFNPIPWGWYPIPVPQGQKLSDVLQDVEVPDLTNNIAEMNYIQEMTDSASGASPMQQGVPLPGRVPFAEAKMVLDQSLQRVKGMSKFYTQAWKDRALIFLKLLEAGKDKLDAVRIYKQGKNTKDIYSREIGPQDWESKLGYRCRVWSQDQKDSQDQKEIQKLQTAVMNIPGNQKLMEIYQRKLLEATSLTPDETLSVLQAEKDKQASGIPGMGGQTGVQPGMLPTGIAPPLPGAQGAKPPMPPQPGLPVNGMMPH